MTDPSRDAAFRAGYDAGVARAHGRAVVTLGVAAVLVTGALFAQALHHLATWAVEQGRQHGYAVALLHYRESLAFVDSVRVGRLRPVWYGTQLIGWQPQDVPVPERRWPR